MNKNMNHKKEFFQKVDEIFLQHSVVKKNDYTKWFAHGEFSLEHLRFFTVQFSVFSNFFLVAQLKKMINAETVEEMRSAKEILANEIGVIFKHPSKHGKIVEEMESNTKQEKEHDDTTPDVVGTMGSIEGGTFRFQAAHFEWLVHFGESLGLTFQDLGKRKVGTASTLHFCDQLEIFYGSEDFSTACGASYAIEHWAAAGFWKELIQGLQTFKTKHHRSLPMGFFKWHDLIEEQHAHHTQDELERLLERSDFDQEKFLYGGQQVLKALEIFWKGLGGTGELIGKQKDVMECIPSSATNSKVVGF
jgi:hypothetical protein